MTYLRRFLEFVASRLFLVTFLSGLFILAFYLAMNTANIWILVDEGLETRATVVLKGEKEEALVNYFREEFIAQDPVLQIGTGDGSPYKDYVIRSFRHEVEMKSVWAWPWENIARAEAVEKVTNIDGSLSAAAKAELPEGTESQYAPPQWESARYRITLLRTAGRWKISNLQMLERITE